MKRLFACTVALGLFAATPTLAASDDHHEDKHDASTPGGSPQSKPNTMHRNVAHGAMPGGSHKMKSAPVPQTAMTRSPSRSAKPSDTHAAANSMGHSKPEARNTTRPNNAAGHASSRASLQINVQASHHFHDGNYRAPQGYQARHWSHGDRLPSGYFARNFWITDFLAFDLFAPPPGHVWVRVANDALLIDEYNGEVVQVDYGVFY
jgi:Ni/Co efflux regulator RcnB